MLNDVLKLIEYELKSKHTEWISTKRVKCTYEIDPSKGPKYGSLLLRVCMSYNNTIWIGLYDSKLWAISGHDNDWTLLGDMTEPNMDIIELIRNYIQSF